MALPANTSASSGQSVTWPFAQVPLPLQAPSLEHFDDRLEKVVSAVIDLRGIRPSTVSWTKGAYRSFRTFLKDSGSERAFLSGDIHRQVEVLQAWIGWLRGRGVSHVGVNTYWRGLRSLLQWLAAQDGTVNPLMLVQTPRFGRSQPRCLTKSTAERLLTFVRHYPWSSRLEATRNLAIIAIPLLAGLRRGEILRLLFGDLDLDAGTLRIRRGKGQHGGKDRTAYAPPQLQMILRTYIEERTRSRRTHPELLTSVRRNAPIGVGAIRELFFRISRDSGIKVSPHALRHYLPFRTMSRSFPEDLVLLIDT